MKLLTIVIILFSNHVFAQTEKIFKEKTSEIYFLFKDDFINQNRPTNLDLFWKGKLPLAITDYGPDQKQFVVSFWGGLFRHQKSTPRTWAFIVCHEIGHILGGFPNVSTLGDEWSSTEGQSDYFAAGSCLKKYYEKQYLSLNIIAPKTVWVKNELIQTAKEMSDFFNFESSSPKDFSSIQKKDLEQVETTITDGYPSNQCRIDTIVAGAQCLNWPCQNGKGKRPRCWYKK